MLFTFPGVHHNSEWRVSGFLRALSVVWHLQWRQHFASHCIFDQVSDARSDHQLAYAVISSYEIQAVL